jgi:leader peptidase (prepilin peptidase)/N-methyltransferase
MAAGLAHATLLTLLLTVTLTDVRARLVPDRALLAACLVMLAVAAAFEPASLPGRALAAFGAGGFLLAATLIRPEGMGLGDVKLAAILGFYLGPGVVQALLFAFVCGSLYGLALLARHGWEARARTIPFAPFLALGAVCALAGGRTAVG